MVKERNHSAREGQQLQKNANCCCSYIYCLKCHFCNINDDNAPGILWKFIWKVGEFYGRSRLISNYVTLTSLRLCLTNQIISIYFCSIGAHTDAVVESAIVKAEEVAVPDNATESAVVETVASQPNPVVEDVATPADAEDSAGEAAASSKEVEEASTGKSDSDALLLSDVSV